MSDETTKDEASDSGDDLHFHYMKPVAAWPVPGGLWLRRSDDPFLVRVEEVKAINVKGPQVIVEYASFMGTSRTNVQEFMMKFQPAIAITTDEHRRLKADR